MPKTRRLHTATQDQILLALYALAKVKVEELVPGCYREEVVHELAAVWLERLRAGGWDLPREDWEDFVVGEIRKRRVEDYRARKRTLRRDGVHLQIITDAPREWMSQDLKIEEERLRGFLDTVRATLPAKCVRAHAMIRDDQLTYAEVAKKLRVSERCVHEYIKTVHQAFRRALRSVGIAATKSPRGGRSKTTTVVNVSTLRGSDATVDVRSSARNERKATAAVNVSTGGGDDSIANVHALTPCALTSTADANASTRGDYETADDANVSSDDANASPVNAHEVTDDVHASTRDDFESPAHDLESTAHDSQSTVHDLKSTGRDLESTARDLQSTVQDPEPTVRDLKSTVQDLQSIAHDLDSTAHVDALTAAVNVLARVTHEPAAGVNTLTGAVCSVPGPVREAMSTVRREPVQASPKADDAREATGGESQSPAMARDATGNAHDTTDGVSLVPGMV
jgi:DNA-directed RNA polymerase specialized sigma24 family protein